MHTYERDIEPQGTDSLARIVARIPAGARVLDVGTGTGALGRYLSTHKRCVVDGLTMNEDEAGRARPAYRRVEVLDLDRALPSQAFAGNRYDAIVCADVLEHVRPCAAVLADLRTLLDPAGRLHISLPNVTYVGVLAELCVGRFQRTLEGILDATHVHFFDRAGLMQLIQSAGFQVAASEDIVRPLIETEFRRLDLASIPRPVWSYLAQQPDAAVYQFLVELAPGPLACTAAPTPPALCGVELTPQFAAQLFLDSGNGFREEESVWSWARSDAGVQILQFALPLETANVRALRLDVSEGEGLFEFQGLEARRDDGTVLWSWMGERLPAMSLHELQLLPAPNGVWLRATGTDPWLSFPLAEAGWSLAHAAALAVRLAPLPSLEAQAFARSESNGSSQELSAMHALLLSIQADLRRNEAEKQGQREEIKALKHSIESMRNSTSWRLTAGLRWLGARLKGGAH